MTKRSRRPVQLPPQLRAADRRRHRPRPPRRKAHPRAPRSLAELPLLPPQSPLAWLTATRSSTPQMAIPTVTPHRVRSTQPARLEPRSLRPPPPEAALVLALLVMRRLGKPVGAKPRRPTHHQRLDPPRARRRQRRQSMPSSRPRGRPCWNVSKISRRPPVRAPRTPPNSDRN